MIADPARFGLCNAGLGQFAQPFIDGRGPGVHVLGLSDANEVVEVAGGSRIEGSLFLFNGST